MPQSLVADRARIALLRDGVELPDQFAGLGIVGADEAFFFAVLVAQTDVAKGAGEQGHAAAVLDGLQLAGVPGQDELPVAGLGVGDQVGQVRAGHGGGLIDQQERPLAGLDRAAGAAPARACAVINHSKRRLPRRIKTPPNKNPKIK